MAVRLGVLASGRGSNLQAIIDAIETGHIEAMLAVVVSNKGGAYALERARRHQVPAVHLDSKPFAQDPVPREAYDRAMLGVLQEHGVDLVVLAGYMRIVTPVLVEAYRWRMMNIHPSLLPAFPGLDAQRQAIEHGVKLAGCTVHFVTEGVDEGPIILQAAVPVLDEDTVESLEARILEQEHRLYPRAIQLFAQGRLDVKGRRVLIREGSQTDSEYRAGPDEVLWGG